MQQKISNNMQPISNDESGESIFDNSELIYKCTRYFDKMFKEVEILLQT